MGPGSLWGAFRRGRWDGVGVVEMRGRVVGRSGLENGVVFGWMRGCSGWIGVVNLVRG